LKKYSLFEGLVSSTNASTSTKKKDSSVPPFFTLALLPKKATAEKEKGDTTASDEVQLGV